MGNILFHITRSKLEPVSKENSTVQSYLNDFLKMMNFMNEKQMFFHSKKDVNVFLTIYSLVHFQCILMQTKSGDGVGASERKTLIRTDFLEDF